MDIDTLTIGIAGVATVGLVTSVMVITSWIRELFRLDGNDVRIAATAVATYIVVCFGLTQATWVLWGMDVAAIGAWLGIGAYLIALIASTASAHFERLRASS